MADIYMHSRMAEVVVKDIDYDFDQKVLFHGAQGPDPLYYNFFSDEHTEYRKYADLMHNSKTDLLFKNMITYVKNNLTTESYSFLVGFICHYALDVKIHPYVYHNVGVYNKDIEETHQYRGLHLKFERSMDAVLIEDDYKFKAHKLNLLKKHLPLRHPTFSVMQIMDYTLKETYQKDHGGVMYLVGTVEMRKIMKRFVRDVSGIKKLILKLVDFYNQKHDLYFQDMSMYNHIEDYDFLNKKRNTWNHPVTNEEYNYSVMDLHDQAVIFAHELIEKVRQYIFEDKDIDLSKVFTNLSFNSGIDCDQPIPMKYFKNYRK